MTQNPFLPAVEKAAKPPLKSDHQKVLEILDQFCDAVKRYPSNRLDCNRLPGFITNLGQEYRIIAHSKHKKFDHLLLRAHVPLSGRPIMLDLYDEDLVECPTPQALQNNLLDFINRDSTRDVLRVLANP